MKNCEIHNLIQNWSKKRINENQTFDEVFKIDDVPLWQLLQYRLYSSLIPRPFKILPEIEKEFVEGKIPGTLDKFKFSLLSRVFKKYLSLNEFLKLNISKFTEKSVILNEKKGILFIDYVLSVRKIDNNKVKLLKSNNLFEKILNDGKLNPVLILCDPISRNSFFKLLSYKNLVYKYIDEDILKESKKLSKELAKKWSDLDIAKKRELFKLSNDKNLWPFIENELNLLFSETILNLVIKYYLTFKKIIKENNIEIAVIETISGIHNTSIIAAAKTLNKKVVFTPHGWGIRTFISKEFSSNIIFAICSSYANESLLKLGLSEENMKIIGNPVFDDIIIHKEKFLRNRLNKKDKYEKTITLLTSPLVENKLIEKETYFRYIKRFIEQIHQIGNIKVILKLHPREKYKKEYEKIVNLLRYENIEITQEIGNEYLYNIVMGSDVVIITKGSTTCTEALILGKYVIEVSGLRNDEWDIPECDAVVNVDKDGDITHVIKEVLYNKNLQKELKIKREKYLKGNFYMLDGKAYERVVNLIYDLSSI